MSLEQIATEAGARLERDVPLSSHTTLRLGGRARGMFVCETTNALVATLHALDAAGMPTLVLAGGSNLVVADGEVDRVVVKIATRRIDIGPPGNGKVIVTAEAGAAWDEVVARSVAVGPGGLGGLECLSGIPGSAGATPVQNVGAYGVEIASVLRRVQLLDRRTGEVAWVEPSTLELGYRTSVLKHSHHAIVLAIELELTADGRSAPLRYGELAAALGAEAGERRPVALVREAVLKLRRGKGMVLDPDDRDTWSAGSFFTNPVVDDALLQTVTARVAERLGENVTMPVYAGESGAKLSAAWLIERAGFGRGYPGPDAPVRLSTRHTLALTNRGRATTADLLTLAREVRAGVEAAFGVRLHPEPVLVGCTL